MLLSFSSSLARLAKVFDQTKCVSLNNEPYMVGPTLIDLNLVALEYYPFMFSVDKCSGSCNSANDLSTKKCVASKTKDINVKAFNIITRMNKYNSITCNSNQKWNNDKCQCECKNYQKCKEDYSWNPSRCTCKNSKYLRIITDDSKIVCDEIIYVMDILPTNTMSPNVTSTLSIDFHNIKVRYKMNYILLAFTLLIILLIICKYYKNTSKQKHVGTQAYTMENNQFKKVSIKNLIYFNFDDVIKIEDFNPSNILLD